MRHVKLLALTLFVAAACNKDPKPAETAAPTPPPPASSESPFSGNVTGADCTKHEDCGNCGVDEANTPPGGLACMCLPELKKCGFGSVEPLE
ncbi:MAG TPA: hypothetical protein VM901_13730 [Bdellovibrionota bacterium]|jgi:hypothetical protein|nr:hypothetical protein [Bdellovibrionota bacterium]